ncbi:hypothetical protein M407DRAFT_20262 [Tulasnella calospora MUT 4182]|uniref:Uncharacterized protein n=1 Tax=Tulasnella calospora MUT 4182 TaxID=1051891 RepID=A0A0C3L9Z5_9AGAM|nr:hypothetical protein M407DRAFT_20262 [Tulasnella calospora MUT 4182]
MKSLALSVSTLLSFYAQYTQGAPATAAVVCPLYLPAPFPNPFEAEKPALVGYYLTASNEQAVLVKEQTMEAFSYSENGPVGLWGSAPRPNACPGYGYLNVPPYTSGLYKYAPLKWGPTASTTWNATIGGDLTKLGAPSSSVFVACKSDAADIYSLFIAGVGALPGSLTDAAGNAFAATKCVQTKISVAAPNFEYAPA